MRFVSSVPSPFLVAAMTVNRAPGFRCALPPISWRVIGVAGGTTIFFSPPLYLTVMVPPSTPVTVAPEAAPLVMVPPGTGSYARWPSPVPRIFSGKMCTSTAFCVPSACGIAALPRKVPSLMSAIDALTTATMLALSASAILSCAPWAVFTVRTLPSTFSIVPLTRWVCAAALAHRAAISAPASTPRMVLVMVPPLGCSPTVYISLVPLRVHRDRRHRARVALRHHVLGRRRIFLETRALAVGVERGGVVVHLVEEYLVRFFRRHVDVERAAARLLHRRGAVLLDRRHELRHVGRVDVEEDRVDEEATRLRGSLAGGKLQQRGAYQHERKSRKECANRFVHCALPSFVGPARYSIAEAGLAAGGFPRKRVGLAGFGGPAVVDRHEYRALKPQRKQVRGAAARRAPVVQVCAHESDARGVVEQPFVRLRTLGGALETSPEARLQLLQLKLRRRQLQDGEEVRRVDPRRPFFLAVDHAHAVALEGAVATVPATVGEPPPPVRRVEQRQVQETPRQQEPGEGHQQQPDDAQVRRRQEADHRRKVGDGEERAPAPAAALGAVYSATPFAFRSCHTFSGVTGISTCVTPRCESASTTAFAIAGGAPTVADSPTPFAPNGWCGEGVMVLSVSHFGHSSAVGT